MAGIDITWRPSFFFHRKFSGPTFSICGLPDCTLVWVQVAVTAPRFFTTDYVVPWKNNPLLELFFLILASQTFLFAKDVQPDTS